jgi:hypothetical protein
MRPFSGSILFPTKGIRRKSASLGMAEYSLSLRPFCCIGTGTQEGNMKYSFQPSFSLRCFAAFAAFGLTLGLADRGVLAQSAHSPALPPPPPVIPLTNSPIQSGLPSPTTMKAIAPGVFELGHVTLNKQLRTVSFPATLNTNQGPQEYFLVTRYGKAHESVLVTDVEPYNIHVAMLLLDATGAGANVVSTAPAAQIKDPPKKAMPGDKITIELSWTADGREIRRPAGQLVFNQEAKAALAGESWVYNGSIVWDGKFLAQRDGSIVSLVTDPTALINNAGAGHDNDHIWASNTNSLPPVNVPIKVTLKLGAKSAK